MNNELMEALDVLEKEKNISKEVLLEAIEQSLLQACKNHFGKADNVKVDINPDTCEFSVHAEKTVVEEVEDPVTEISLVDAKMKDSRYEVGDVVNVEIKSKEFGRIATQNAKNVILQKIREEERKVLYNEYYSKEREVVTGIVQRYLGRNVSINLGKVDAILNENEMVKGETFRPTERIKVYVLEVKDTPKGPKVLVSRTHPELVKRLFESEVTEVRDGTVEIKCIAREAGNRTKMAVWSNDPDVDAVGACVGINGSRVNTIVEELRGEKIDIINWDENPALLIENALSPAKVIYVAADNDEKTAKVVVPDYQLSLAIGKEGQNARLAARLTGFKIDIKSETQAIEAGDFDEMEEEEYYEDDYDEYSDTYADDYSGQYEEGELYEEEPEMTEVPEDMEEPELTEVPEDAEEAETTGDSESPADPETEE
ncbi:putative transcription termination factor NusA [Marvinbryantia formatexigens DSM 14469]|uniref:Transcription termination/antitermination protein NusA n=1 Tax=Marvinbryantia formatexigens DSM 14469 TaxID=478749 RepID=C6LLB3_9FIRM|nr:transcription termination factor NusA [Marvinbryantia formatexigens]EET58624.1 putative transcription termination factor NusA [Marvinbryantia formatexigens DSM 14469]UWO25491.1 transcription termination factor NusA [Marvinbryantia formatexigens DSM 14469]SDG91804.1 NusA antitermination factor [Marvinbryantia formatexigens]